MTEEQEKISIKIISFLKVKGLVNQSDIASHVGTGPFKNNLLTAIETLKEEGIISEPRHQIYKITSYGSTFESFEKHNENNSLQIRLAKSNIEANELQKIIAERNELNERKNRKHSLTNTVVSIILCLLTAIQVILLIRQS